MDSKGEVPQEKLKGKAGVGVEAGESSGAAPPKEEKKLRKRKMKLLKPAEGIAKKQKKKTLLQNLDSAAEKSKATPGEAKPEETPATKPMVEEPSTAKKAAKKPVVEEPSDEITLAEETAVEEKSADEPVAEKSVAEEPAGEKSAAEKPEAEEKAAEQVVTEAVVEPVPMEAMAIETAAMEPVAVDPVAVELVAVGPIAVEPIAVEPLTFEGMTPIEEDPETEPSGSGTAQSADPTYSILDENSSIMTDDDSSEEYDMARDWNNYGDEKGDMWEQNQWQYDTFFAGQNFSDYQKKRELANGGGSKKTEDVAVGPDEGIVTKDVGVGPGPTQPATPGVRRPQRYTITTQTMKLLLREMDPIAENYKAERIRMEEELKESMSQPIVFDCEKAHELEKIKKKNLAIRHEEVAVTLQKRFSIFLSALEAADLTITGEI